MCVHECACVCMSVRVCACVERDTIILLHLLTDTLHNFINCYIHVKNILITFFVIQQNFLKRQMFTKNVDV